MPVQGNSARYGPFSEEMWNMLALYNPWSFRVTLDGAPQASSPWVTFTLQATAGATLPGRVDLIRMAALFWLSEAGFLVGGIGTGLVEMLRVAGRLPLADVIGGGLLLAILAGLLRPYVKRLGPERARAWARVVLYTGLIYATLPVMPHIWIALHRHTQGRIDYTGVLVTVLAGLGLLVYLVSRCRRLVAFVAVPPVAVLYGLLLARLGESPAERLHLAEYGILSFLVLTAMQIDIPRRAAYFWGWLVAGALGGIDEAIQWILPNRVFEWKDVGLNLASAGLGMAVVALLIEFRKEREG
jgi:hypothetical protein